MNQQVAGYVIGYKGLVFATVRGAGHMVPYYQPRRALALFSSFLEGELPPRWSIKLAGFVNAIYSFSTAYGIIGGTWGLVFLLYL